MTVVLLPGTVVVADDASVVERFAAAELARYLGRIANVDVPIAATAPATGMPLYVGTRFANQPASKPGHDGYVLHVGDDGVVIAGANERGTLYGVYDLLERLGCRWYYPAIDPADPELIPSNPNPALAPFDCAEAAGFEFRVAHPGSMLFNLDVPLGLAQVDWAAKARYNILAFLQPNNLEATVAYQTSGVVDEMRKRGLLLEGPLHCGFNFLPNELFDAHPEWFGLGADGGRHRQAPLGPEFCWSNADAVEAFAANAVAWVAEFPFVDIFAFTPNDGGRPCACEPCRERSPSDWYARLANVIKARLETAGLARPVEITGAYAPCEEPPSPGVLDPDIRVHWAHWGRRWTAHYGDSDYSLRDNLDAWLDRAHPFTMVEYHCSGFANPAIHSPIARVLGVDNAWLLARGARGNLQLMNDCRTQSWWNGGLQAWLSGMSFYYTDRDPIAFTDDYAARYFGAPAAPFMVDLCRLLEDEPWLTFYAAGGPRWTGPEEASREHAVRAVPLLDRIEALLRAAAEVTRNPVEGYRLNKFASLYELFVAAGRARARYAPLIHRGATRAELEEALRFEHEVIEPMIAALPAGVGSSDLATKLGSDGDRIAKALADL